MFLCLIWTKAGSFCLKFQVAEMVKNTDDQWVLPLIVVRLPAELQKNPKILAWALNKITNTKLLHAAAAKKGAKGGRGPFPNQKKGKRKAQLSRLGDNHSHFRGPPDAPYGAAIWLRSQQRLQAKKTLSQENWTLSSLKAWPHSSSSAFDAIELIFSQLYFQ